MAQEAEGTKGRSDTWHTLAPLVDSGGKGLFGLPLRPLRVLYGILRGFPS